MSAAKAKTTWGIRIRKHATDRWQRGKQFRRTDETESGWVEWRDEWPNEAAANLRLAQYRAGGWFGHVFEIEEPVKPVVYPTATHYSPNFTRAELDCKCDCKTPPAVEHELTITAANLELLRHELGGIPLGITSGYRCPKHNKEVHGASQSKHLTGEAADLAVPKGEQEKYVKAAERVPAFQNGGIGVYPGGGVHVDHRGYRARWNDWVRT